MRGARLEDISKAGLKNISMAGLENIAMVGLEKILWLVWKIILKQLRPLLTPAVSIQQLLYFPPLYKFICINICAH